MKAMATKNSNNLLVVFGKKPRKSKTSLRYEYMGYKFYLYSNKANTSGNYMLFYDVEPYPLIAVFGMSQGEDYTIVHDWIKSHLADIKKMLGDYRDKIQIPYNSWLLIQKNNKKINRTYEIYDDGKMRAGTRLVFIEVDGSYLYLRVGGKYPTRRTSMNNVVPEAEMIYDEYIRRKDERITRDGEISDRTGITQA